MLVKSKVLAYILAIMMAFVMMPLIPGQCETSNVYAAGGGSIQTSVEGPEGGTIEWHIYSGGQPISPDMVEAGKTVYVIVEWNRNVNFDKNSGITCKKTSTGESVTIIDDVVQEGQAVFYFTMPDADVAIHAIFTERPPTEWDISKYEENCTVNISPTSAIRGTPITVTVTPNTGYAVNSFDVYLEEDWSKVDYTQDSNDPNKFTFLMPDYSVEVDVVCKTAWAVSFNSNGGGGTMDVIYVAKGKSITVPECAFTPPQNVVFSGWNTVAQGTSGNYGTWYHPGDQLKPTDNMTLYARYGDPGLSVCSYDSTNSKSMQGGKFKVTRGTQDASNWSYGCNNYTVTLGTRGAAEAMPDNGYKFLGWYKGKYLYDSPYQDAVPFIDNEHLITRNIAFEFTVNDNMVICPVFEAAPQVHFIDVGNVWTKLDPVNEVPFTAEINPDVTGLSNYIEIIEEKWTSEGVPDITPTNPGVPIAGHTYTYSITIGAKEGNVFVPDIGFNFVYGGTPYDYQELNVQHSLGFKKVTISGFVPAQTVTPVDITDAAVSGIADKAYTGEAIEQSPVVKMDVNGTAVTLQDGTDYEINYTNNMEIGQAAMTITGAGNYTGTIEKTFKIVPKKPGQPKAKVGKKQVKVTMTAAVSATGGDKYKVQYRVKGTSKWKSKTTAKKTLTIKKLKKGKRYQIRVQAFKIVGDATYSSAWSKIRTTKKIK